MSYTIGQVEKLSGVRQNVLRYWEEQIPSFSPKKDISGRRIYSERDLEIVLRLKNLIYTQKFTLDGARRRILEEADGLEMNSEVVTKIRQMRAELGGMLVMLGEIKKSREARERLNERRSQ